MPLQTKVCLGTLFCNTVANSKAVWIVFAMLLQIHAIGRFFAMPSLIRGPLGVFLQCRCKSFFARGSFLQSYGEFISSGDCFALSLQIKVAWGSFLQGHGKIFAVSLQIKVRFG